MWRILRPGGLNRYAGNYMRVSLISTEGPWLEALISTPHGNLSVMDEFTSDKKNAPKEGNDFEIELSATLLDDDESWDSMFNGNPDKRKALEQIEGWQYRAYGEVTSINPVVVDCGIIQIPDVFNSNDPRVVGEFIAFTVSRLEATQFNQ